MHKVVVFLLLISGGLSVLTANAHHVLGRPAYSLNEDSNTPPSVQIESVIGDYFVTAMVFPAFPKPGQRGRINFYATHLKTQKPFTGKVAFKIRNDSWFNTDSEKIGSQLIDDSVYRQGFVIKERGAYIITVSFVEDNEPYIIDFPLQIGVPAQITLPVIIVGVIILFILMISILQSKRLMRTRIQETRVAKKKSDNA